MYSTTIMLTLANTAYSIVTLARAARVDVACPSIGSQLTIEADRDHVTSSGTYTGAVNTGIDNILTFTAVPPAGQLVHTIRGGIIEVVKL